MSEPRPPQPAPHAAAMMPAERWQHDLEEAYVAVRALALAIERDLDAADWLVAFAARIAAGQRALLDAFDGREERALCAQRAMHEVDGARAAVPGTAPSRAVLQPALGAARAALARAEERLATRPPAVPEAPELRVSVDTPRLHWVPRASVVPRIAVPALVMVVPAPVVTAPARPHLRRARGGQRRGPRQHAGRGGARRLAAAGAAARGRAGGGRVSRCERALRGRLRARARARLLRGGDHGGHAAHAAAR
ncbi:MAG: hypothetical protein WKG00_21825 [Polyangiaceae bacterium]